MTDYDRSIVLLGDSTIDNKFYTNGGNDVFEHVLDMVPDGSYVTSLARDGARVPDVVRQMGSIPEDATHLIVSVGGNDALEVLHILDRPARTVAEGIERVGYAVSAFEMEYRALIDEVVDTGLPATVCTIYNGAFPERERYAIKSAARMFNEVILQVASDAGLPVIDLRQVCDEHADYYNPIEPSDIGGKKIAEAFLRAAVPGWSRPAPKAGAKRSALTTGGPDHWEDDPFSDDLFKDSDLDAILLPELRDDPDGWTHDEELFS